MALGVFTSGKFLRGHGRGVLAGAWLGLIVPTASCVPVGVAQAPELAVSAAAPSIPAPLQPIAHPAAARIDTVSAVPGPFAAAHIFRGRTPLDRLRSLDCLAQAVYYEARSEDEDGQRAVAQVVLNRVRHPAWPNSVCGVVYQGPMRPGGGCQFTFTCDGSLALRPAGIGWARARTVAAEALAGRTYDGVGLSTHYHTQAVFPSWAPRLVRTAMIGAHNFYRLPGLAGMSGAFAARYSGSEPLPVPGPQLVRRAAVPLGLASLTMAFTPSPTELRAAAALPSDIPQDSRWNAANLPESTIREEYRGSGQWRADAPASITGR